MNTHIHRSGIVRSNPPPNWLIHLPATHRLDDISKWRAQLNNLSVSQTRAYFTYFVNRHHPYDPPNHQYGAVYVRLHDVDNQFWEVPRRVLEHVFGDLGREEKQPTSQTYSMRYHGGLERSIPVPTIPTNYTLLQCAVKPHRVDTTHDLRFVVPENAYGPGDFQQRVNLRQTHTANCRTNPFRLGVMMTMSANTAYGLLKKQLDTQGGAYHGVLTYPADRENYTKETSLKARQTLLAKFKARNAKHMARQEAAVERTETIGLHEQQRKRRRRAIDECMHAELNECAKALGWADARESMERMQSYLEYYQI